MIRSRPIRIIAGADRAVTLVLLTRLALLLAAPVTLWLVATKRPLAEQGLFFILWNIQALTQLMELGVGTLIVQFASHEAPLLAWTAHGGLDGDPRALLRIRQVVHDGRRWYRRIALALTLVAGCGGAWLVWFRASDLGHLQVVPWVVAVACTGAYLPLVPSLCAIEGCGGLLRVQRMRLAQTVASIAVLWITLVALGALWGVAAFAATWLTIAWVWLRLRHRDLFSANPALAVPVLADARHHRPLSAVQWRAGVSWLAWWIGPQAVTPIVLAAHGATAAGQVGMSFAIATAPLTLAISWLQARYPQYGSLLARGKFDELRRLARVATVQAGVVCAAGVLGASLVVWLLGRFSPALGGRALPAPWIVVVGVANLAWLLVQSLGSYLRAWRQEPLMETAVVGAVLVSIGTLAAASRWSTTDVVASYVILVVGGALPLAVAQFRHQFRRATEASAAEEAFH